MDDDFIPDYGLHILQKMGSQRTLQYYDVPVNVISQLRQDLYALPLLFFDEIEYFAIFAFPSETLLELLNFFPDPEFRSHAQSVLLKDFYGEEVLDMTYDPLFINTEAVLEEPKVIKAENIVPFKVIRFWQTSIN